MHLASCLRAAAAQVPDRTAVRLEAVELSYRDLDLASARVAGLLAERGVHPGDRVAVMLPNACEFAVVYYGVLRAGCVVVPLNPLARDREIAYQLADCGARFVFAWHAVTETAEAAAARTGAGCVSVTPGEFDRLLRAAPPAHALVPRGPGDTAAIFYTAGTTGRRKGAELTHANLLGNALQVARLHRLTERTVTLGALPLYHAFGQTCALNATISAGGCVTLLARFEAGKALEVIERDGVSVLQAVPTMYAALLNHPGRDAYDLSRLRLCVSGGAAMPGELMRGFEEAFGCPIIEGYGLTETSPVAASNPSFHGRKPGSIGRPIDGVEMRVVDEDGRDLPPGAVGEIVLRGANLMKGYWNRPLDTLEVIRDGWFHTGDLAWKDAEGYFFIVDRRIDMIVRGGRNVYPREIEEVLYEHPCVREAAVFGVPHPELGEEVAAAVTVKNGHGVDAAQLREFVSARVSAESCPRRIWFFHELPKSGTGKILKRRIAAMAEASAR